MSAEATCAVRLSWRQIGLALCIVLLAFALRGAVSLQRAGADVWFWPTQGRDDHAYWMQAQAALKGDWPTQTHYYHPGQTYNLSMAGRIIGAGLPQLTLYMAWLDALTCAFVIGAGWLLTRRAWGGLFAGGIYALYPVAVFYATTLLIAPLAAFLLGGWLFLTLWQREKLTLWRTVLLGGFAGAIALSRMNLFPIAGLYLFWMLALRPGWWRGMLHLAVYGLVAALLIAPTTLHNYRASEGHLIFVATTGSAELYMANNRDGQGRHGVSPAMANIDTSYMAALWRDVQLMPEHIAGILAYKFALFFSALEPGNNLTFQASADATPLLNALPGNFHGVLLAGLLGIGVLWAQDRERALLIAALVAWIALSYTLTFAFGRIRHPVIVPLAAVAPCVLVAVWDGLRGKTAPVLWLRPCLMPAILSAVLIGFSGYVLTETDIPRLPRERTYRALPADAIAVDVAFGEVVLRGWRPVTLWPAAQNGWMNAAEAYTIELLWQVPQGTDIEHNFYLAYFDDGQRLAGLDRPLGAVGFPFTTTQRWQDDVIYGEIVSLRLDDVPLRRSGQMRVGVWYWDDDGLIVNVQPEGGGGNLLLDTLAVYKASHAPPAPDLRPVDVTFGGLIQLNGVDLPQAAARGETITLTMGWRALRHIDADYTLLIHLDDAQGNIAAQGDNHPIPGLLTSNWQPDVALFSRLPLTMPDVAGTYGLYVGLYDAAGRLPTGTPDARVHLGSIKIE